MAEITVPIPDFETALSVFREHDNPLTQVLGVKALMQAAVIQDEFNPHVFAESDPSREPHPELPLAQIGEFTAVDIDPFRVLPTRARTTWESPSGELHINKGELYLDFHLIGVGEGYEDANTGYANMAQFVRNNAEIGKVLGVTYKTMARHAQSRQGFNIERIVLPDEVQAQAVRVWMFASGKAKERHFQDAFAVWMDRKDFLEKFLPDSYM